MFRTAEGTKLAGAVLGESVAFEADGYDAADGSRVVDRRVLGCWSESTTGA